jgi:septal ring factor EnvC (AmiA/AmiB activator)
MRQKLTDELKNVTKISDTIKRQIIQIKNRPSKLATPYHHTV